MKCKLHKLVEDIFADPCKLSAFIKALSTVYEDQLDFKKYINEDSSVCVIKTRSNFFSQNKLSYFHPKLSIQ